MSSEAERLDALAGNVAGERARVDETVKEIQHKLTPGQLIDEVLRQGGEPAVNAIAGLGKTIAAHPVPALLIGTALVWLAIERRPAAKDQPPPTSPAA
jgi:hypothetical protein